MNLFDRLVDEALRNQPHLSSLRIVVEKELLHHDILRILNQNELLPSFTFIGGTCLRACYGGVRLSEDLCFTSSKSFSRKSLSTMGKCLADTLNEKYRLKVIVSEPEKDIKNIDTWKIKVETRPKQRHLPSQRINIDICAVPSYEKKPMMLINPYGVDMGTSGLTIQAQTREEIYSDKLLAFALRPNRIKYRDLWDIVWLHQQGLKPNFELVAKKLNDRDLTQEYFSNLYEQRLNSLSKDNRFKIEFKKEMRRFLSLEEINKTTEQDDLWSFIIFLMKSFAV